MVIGDCNKGQQEEKPILIECGAVQEPWFKGNHQNPSPQKSDRIDWSSILNRRERGKKSRNTVIKFKGKFKKKKRKKETS